MKTVQRRIRVPAEVDERFGRYEPKERAQIISALLTTISADVDLAALQKAGVALEGIRVLLQQSLLIGSQRGGIDAATRSSIRQTIDFINKLRMQR